MKLYFTQFILLGALVSPFSALFAQHTGQDPHEVRLTVAPEDTSQAMSKEDLRRLMDEAHEALETGEKVHDHHNHHHEHCPNCTGGHHPHGEHGHTHGFSFQKLISKDSWKEKFNFKQVLLNALRWYQLKATDEEVKVHVANIITMLLASHFSEGVIGTQIAQTGLQSDYLAVKTLGVLLGTSIIIPGLDPLCIALVWTYKKVPHLMGKMMYVPRVIILQGASLVYRSLGLKAVMNNLFYKQDALERLEFLLSKKSSSTEVFHFNPESIDMVVKHKGREIFTLIGKMEGQRIVWERMFLTKDLKDPEILAYLKKELAPLSWLLRQSVYDIIKRLDDPNGIKRLSYIDNAAENFGLIDVRIKSRGMASLPPTKFIGAKNCLFKLLMAVQ